MIVAVKPIQNIQVDQSWLNLLDYVRQHPFCRLEIEFKEGKPIIALKALESVKF